MASETKVDVALDPDSLKPLSVVSNNYSDSSAACGTSATGHHFPAPTTKDASGHDLDGTVLPSDSTAYTYDACGNPLTVNTSVSDDSSVNRTYSYSADVANWLLGRIATSTIASTVNSTGGGGGGSNSPPTANNDNISTSINTAVTFDPRANDTDPDADALTITAASSPGHGTASIGGGGPNYLQGCPRESRKATRRTQAQRAPAQSGQ